MTQDQINLEQLAKDLEQAEKYYNGEGQVRLSSGSVVKVDNTAYAYGYLAESVRQFLEYARKQEFYADANFDTETLDADPEAYNSF